MKYTPNDLPEIFDMLRRYLTNEFNKISRSVPTYSPGIFPQSIDNLRTFLSAEFKKISEAIK